MENIYRQIIKDLKKFAQLNTRFKKSAQIFGFHSNICQVIKWEKMVQKKLKKHFWWEKVRVFQIVRGAGEEDRQGAGNDAHVPGQEEGEQRREQGTRLYGLWPWAE